jgi:diguanylate cyclase (GGDEF)-like protein
MDDWDETTGETSVPLLESHEHRAYLVALQGSSVGAVFPLGQSSALIGRGADCDLVLLDHGVSRKHAEIALEGSRFYLRDLGSRNGTYCSGKRIESCLLRHGDKISMGGRTVLRFTVGDDLDEQFQRRMYESAVHDGLTGAFNRQRFVEQVESELARAKRHRTPTSLLMLDLDHFKRVNDRHGHAAGDKVLRVFARCVQGLVRADEMFARVGGEEFAVLAAGADADAARLAAERIREAVEALEIRYSGSRIRITVSIGVACAGEVHASDAATFTAAADAALYEAKGRGRNRVAVFHPNEFDRETRIHQTV